MAAAPVPPVSPSSSEVMSSGAAAALAAAGKTSGVAAAAGLPAAGAGAAASAVEGETSVVAAAAGLPAAEAVLEPGPEFLAVAVSDPVAEVVVSGPVAVAVLPPKPFAGGHGAGPSTMLKDVKAGTKGGGTGVRCCMALCGQHDEVSLRWACCGQAAEAWPCWDQLEGIDIDSLTVPMEKQDACDSLTVLEDEKAGSA